jgi:hypothetical protein
MKHIIADLLLACVLSGLSVAAAWAAEAPVSPSILVSAPMHVHDQIVTLPVMIDGKGPYLFGIDTGAGEQARVSADVAKALKLPVVGEVRARGLGPREVVEPIVRMSVLVGSLRINIDAEVAQRTLKTGVQGILAFGFFKDYILSLDYPNDRVQVRRGSITSATAGAIAFSMRHGVPSVAGLVAGVAVAFDVDTGSGGYVGLDGSLVSRIPFVQSPATVGRACGIGGCVDVKGGVVKGVLVIAGIRLEQPRVDLLPLPIQNIGNLGYRFLKGYHIEFDQRSGFAVIEK